MMSWDSVVTIATRYKLDGPGTESRWWQHFLHMSRLAVGPTQPPIKWVSFPELKCLVCCLDHPPPHLAPRLKKE